MSNIIQRALESASNPLPEGRLDDILLAGSENPLLQNGYVTTSLDGLWPVTADTDPAKGEVQQFSGTLGDMPPGHVPVDADTGQAERKVNTFGQKVGETPTGDVPIGADTSPADQEPPLPVVLLVVERVRLVERTDQGAPQGADMAVAAEQPAHVTGERADVGAFAALRFEYRLTGIMVLDQGQFVNLDRAEG